MVELNSIVEQLETIRESEMIELKGSRDLPKAFWETYSAFCNTSGGVIILGVKEGSPKNEITGVGNKEKVISDLWNQLSNPQKVSFNNIRPEDVICREVDGNDVILVKVDEVPNHLKPVYLQDKLENTYLRTGDGDRKATRDQLSALLRNAQPIEDGLIAEDFSIQDLDSYSIKVFKERVSERYPSKEYDKLSAEQFLNEIGAGRYNRKSNVFQLYKGTVLFFGKVNAIHEIFPRFHLDFFNRRGSNPRWVDRVTDDEPSEHEMNIFNFYSIVHEKLKLLTNNSFELGSDQIRLPSQDVDEALRECLINCLAHADYAKGYPSTRITAYDGWFSFLNPGKMLIPKENFISGGDSRPRNEIIMKFFRLLGVSERQGFGGPLIFKTAQKNDFRCPEIDTDIEHTELRLWSIDLADSYPDLDLGTKTVLRALVKSKRPRSTTELKAMTNMTDYAIRKHLGKLMEKKIVSISGSGPSTKYYVVREKELLTTIQILMEDIKKSL